ncbi:hypothetical protein ACFRAU_11040 [Arthrobacter sp. NPDC056691]|uniref:hypothetical protein n=1 Tax=Arthrobacter sp. NPDC056691 TaxID=3345913 RepID=UPI00366F7428
MANPAELLHQILSDWVQEPTKPIYSSRGIHDDESLMQRHRRAIRLIDEIDQIVSGMDLPGSRRDSIQRNLAKWTKWVFAYPHNWLQVPDKGYPNLWDQDALDALDLVAHLLENQVPKVDEASRDSYLTTINEVITALGADETLPADLRKHIYIIAAHARHCLEDYEMTGDFALQAAVERLATAVQMAMSFTKSEGAWSKFRDKLFFPTVAGLVASGPQLAIAFQSMPGSGGA